MSKFKLYVDWAPLSVKLSFSLSHRSKNCRRRSFSLIVRNQTKTQRIFVMQHDQSKQKLPQKLLNGYEGISGLLKHKIRLCNSSGYFSAKRRKNRFHYTGCKYLQTRVSQKNKVMSRYYNIIFKI